MSLRVHVPLTSGLMKADLAFHERVRTPFVYLPAGYASGSTSDGARNTASPDDVRASSAASGKRPRASPAIIPRQRALPFPDAHAKYWSPANSLLRPGPAPGPVFRSGRWSSVEHETFLRGLAAHGRDWVTVSRLVGTRTKDQTRKHAQKYFAMLARKKAKRGGAAATRNGGPRRDGSAASTPPTGRLPRDSRCVTKETLGHMDALIARLGVRGSEILRKEQERARSRCRNLREPRVCRAQLSEAERIALQVLTSLAARQERIAWRSPTKQKQSKKGRW